MKKLLYIGLFMLVACDDLTELDINPKAAEQVPVASLVANAEKSLMDWCVRPNVNFNIYRLITQQWTETTYIDESNYDLNTRTIPDNQWHTLYRDVLRDLQEAKNTVGKGLDVTDPAGMQANQKAIIEMLEVYSWAILVQTFGDIPYSQALDFNALTPVYDDGLTISKDLVVRLDAALAELDNSEGAFGDGDLVYASDIDRWAKFGNSLKLRIGMSLADVDAAAAKTIVEQAAPNAFQSNDDNAVFQYLSAPPNTNQVWVDLVQSGRNDFVAANTLVDFMNAKSDPRRPAYFTLDGLGTAYTGGIYGSNNNFATYSHVSDAIQAPDFEALLMDYAEVEFYLAEAVERGMSVGGTAESHYNEAITASMEYWGVSDADIATYLAKPSVAYATAAGTYKQKIGEQSWVAFYNRGFEAWTQWRRLDFPVLVAPPDALSAIPVRYTYPTSEQNLNNANYKAASAKIGADVVATKLFFDKF
jgi:hypothetical protein